MSAITSSATLEKRGQNSHGHCIGSRNVNNCKTYSLRVAVGLPSYVHHAKLGLGRNVQPRTAN